MRTVLLMFVALLFLVVACDGDGDAGEVLPATDGPTPVATLAGPQATPCFPGDVLCMPAAEEGGNLTAEQKQRAAAIAAADPVVAGLLEDAGYEAGVGDSGWIPGLGVTLVTVNYTLDNPLAIDTDLPGIDSGARGSEADPTKIALPPPYYLERVSHYRLQALQLTVLVHLEEDKVIEIFPIPFGPAPTNE